MASVRHVKVPRTARVDEYQGLDHLGPIIAEVKLLGAHVADALGTRRVWMLNSTEHGGGVAEMLPRLESLLNDVGVDTRWLVVEPDDPEFFRVTKTLHNLIHGEGELPEPDHAREVIARVSARAAPTLREHVSPRDLLIVHDPQPLAIPCFLPEGQRPELLWRCHIGLPWSNRQTELAWRLLGPWLQPYQRLIFSVEQYIPDALRERSAVMHPSIDPLSHKNRHLSLYKQLGVLRAAKLIDGPEVPEWARFRAPVKRFVEGSWRVSPVPDLLFSPIVLQVSRFDRLKGFQHLIPAFEHLLREWPSRVTRLRADSERIRCELERVQLVLAGPDPVGVSDDPEAEEVLQELCAQHAALPKEVGDRVHLLRLPMDSPKENALTVNALQRLAAVIVQNSLREGFGLTVTEAMWKRVPVVAADVGGISVQIRDGTDGLLIDDPADPVCVAEALLEMLSQPHRADDLARSARVRVHDSFLVLTQLRAWLLELQRVLGLSAPDLGHAAMPMSP